ncbi:MAG: VWA domain-containing protein [Bacteroidales bacterium]
MKKLFSFLTILFFHLPLFAQLTYQLTVVDQYQKPMTNLPVVLKETSTREKLNLYTDGNGVVNIELTTGRNWTMSVGKMYNYKLLEVPESGNRKTKEFMTYDLERWEKENRPMPDRSKIIFQTVKQNVFNSTKSTKTESVVEVIIKKANKGPLANFPVNMTNLKDSIIYTGKTDEQGIARFLLPVDKEYEIDLDGIESFSDMKILSPPGRAHCSFTYEPTEINETDKQDTITQDLAGINNGTTARMLYTITVKSSQGNPLQNEPVFLKMVGSKKVYIARTNDQGQAVFLLPKKKKYLIDLEYQKDINVVDLSQVLSRGIGAGQMSITYKPDPRLQYPEQYIPTVESLLINEFNNFLTKQFPKPEKGKALRMIVKWGNEIINGKSKEALLEIGFTATNDESNAYGPPINISFVMDKSGSMAGDDRIEELKKSLVHFINSLRPNDIASLIVYDSQEEMLLPAGKIGGRTNDFVDAINQVQAGGYTNMLKAMILGYEEILKNKNPKGTNRLILLTDGWDENEPKVLADKSKEYNAKGIELSAIGVGSDYNQALLRILATHGGGLFQHVGNSADLQETFKHELSGMLYPVAKDVTVEISYNNKIIFRQLYGFEFNPPKNNVVRMKLDNVYPGLNKLALVKFDLNKPDKTIENMPVIIKMTWFDYRLNKTETSEEKAYLKWDEATGKTELVMENEEKKLYAIAIMNQSLKVMADGFSQNNYVKAEDAVNRCIEQIQELYPGAKDTDVENLYRTLKEYSTILKQYKLNKIKKKIN